MKKTQRTLRKVAVAILGLSLVSLLTACAQSGDDPASIPSASSTPDSATSPATANPLVGPMEFTDDLGNTVTVESTERVVAGLASLGNMWELAGGTLVGVPDDAYDEFEFASPDMTLIGNLASPNAEVIVSLEPDLVILTGAGGGRGTAGSSQTDLESILQNAGIPVAYFKVTTLEDYLRVMEIMTDLTGDAQAYVQYGTQVKEEVDAIIAQVPAGEAPLVAAAITFSGGTRLQNATTQTGSVLADLGAVNLADEHPSGAEDYSLESLVAINPDYIFIVPMGNSPEEADANLVAETTANPAWASLSAVQEGRFHTLDTRLFNYKPNASWPEAYQVLFDHLYG